VSIACHPKVAGSSLNRSFSIIILSIWLTNQAILLHQTQTATEFFCKSLVLIISFYVVCFFGVHCFSSAVLLNKTNYNLKNIQKKQYKKNTKYLNQKKETMEKCETQTTILSSWFHVITKSDTYALLIRLSSISTVVRI